jgi:hypothetical protein
MVRGLPHLNHPDKTLCLLRGRETPACAISSCRQVLRRQATRTRPVRSHRANDSKLEENIAARSINIFSKYALQQFIRCDDQ